MARRYDYVPPELDSRYDSSDNYDDEASMGQDWLDANDPSIASERAINGRVDGEDLNGISITGLMEHRVSSMEPGVRAAIKTLMGSSMGDFKSAVATENFYNLTGEDPRAFARRIKVPELGGKVTITDEYGNTRTETPRAYSAADMRTAQGMFTEEGIAKYVNRGVGSSMEGATYGVDSVEKAYRASLSDAYATMRALAPMVIDPKVPRGTAAYETRVLKAEEELIRHAMESVKGGRGIPTPNLLNVRGRRGTEGNATFMGTPFTPLEYGKAISEGGALYGNEEAWKFKPNARLSYGFEKDQWEEIKEAWYDASKTIRKSTLTWTDEARGNAERMSGYQQSREDWDAKTNAMNEAAIQDMDMYQPEFIGSEMELPKHVTPEILASTAGRTSGSNTGGIYGERGLSERDIFVENYREDDGIDPFTERGQYRAKYRGAPAQGTPQWLAQRKGVDFTASTIGILGTSSGTEKLAVNLKAASMGVKEGFDTRGKYTKDTSFIGNKYTKEGQDFEYDVRQFFMARHGSKMGLEFEEAFFEKGSGELSNFGVTPDGRLYDKSGKSRGLAEFKLLRDTTLDKAYDTYYDQVQLQLAVTGESEAHLFALDQYTDESRYHHITADPERQEFLIKEAKAAKALAQDMSASGAEDMIKAIKGKQIAQATADSVVGDDAIFTPVKEESKQDYITSFKPTGAENTRFAEQMKKADQADKMKEALANARGSEEGLDIMGPPEPESLAKARKDLARERLARDAKNSKYRLMEAGEVEGEAHAEHASRLKEEESKEVKKLTNAVAGATSSLIKFGVIASQTGKALAAMAKPFSDESAVDEHRLAAETGFDVEGLRGARIAMETGNMSVGAIDATFKAAGEAQMAMSDDTKLGAFATQLNVRLLAARRSMPELAHLPMLDPMSLSGMSGQEFISQGLDMMQGLPPSAAKKVAQALGLPSELALAARSISGNMVRSAWTDMNTTGVLDQNYGYQYRRRALLQHGEKAQGISQMAGEAAAVGEYAGDRASIPGMLGFAAQETAIGVDYLGDNQAIPTPEVIRTPYQAEKPIEVKVNNTWNIDKDGNVDTRTDVNGVMDSEYSNVNTGD